MRSFRISVLLTFALAPLAFAQAPAPATRAAATITPEDVKAHIAFLASDSLQGRDTPSPGLELAATYIGKQFASYGLKPAGDSGTFIQRWPFTSQKLDTEKVRTELVGTGKSQTLAYGSEYFVVPASRVPSLEGEVVFAGGATADMQPNAAYKDNIVAFYVPGSEMGQSWLQTFQASIGAAIRGGARGVVAILDPEFDASDIANVVSNIGNARVPVPVVAIRNDAGTAWLKGTGIEFAAATAPVEPKPTGVSVKVHAGMTGSTTPVPNVVAVLEGSDPELKNTYVVYSAHMDHVGVGRPDAKGDSIYNGADDDASGTSAVLEVAQAFAALQPRPKRSIIFLTVSGEEKGLHGSRYFTANPPVPAEQIVANINLDMVGRNSPDTTVAIGQEYSSLGPVTQQVVKAHPELKLTVAPDLWPQERLFFRSDHYNFAMKKIPAIFFTSGLHPDYHQPSDHAENIDNDKLARTAQLVFWLGHEIADNPVAPAWTEEGLKAITPRGAN